MHSSVLHSGIEQNWGPTENPWFIYSFVDCVLLSSIHSLVPVYLLDSYGFIRTLDAEQ